MAEGVLESAHALMSAAMIDAKRARMRVEGERQMLANRLARLQSEELRATIRILLFTQDSGWYCHTLAATVYIDV